MLKKCSDLCVIQRIHRWRSNRGAEAGEGRRDQHLLCSFRSSVREVPQVSPVSEGSGLLRNPQVLVLGVAGVSSLFSVSFLLNVFIPSQDYDDVGSEEHQNSSQILVPQELPVPYFQGRIFKIPF